MSFKNFHIFHVYFEIVVQFSNRFNLNLLKGFGSHFVKFYFVTFEELLFHCVDFFSPNSIKTLDTVPPARPIRSAIMSLL